MSTGQQRGMLLDPPTWHDSSMGTVLRYADAPFDKLRTTRASRRPLRNRLVTGRGRDARGHAVAIEAAIILPVLVLFAALVIVLARETLAHQSVGGAASQAARAASLERSPAAARAAADSVAGAALRDANVACAQRHVTVDTAGLRAPLGTPSSVSVTVVCTLAHDVALPGFPQQRRVSETRTSPVDSYRGR